MHEGTQRHDLDSALLHMHNLPAIHEENVGEQKSEEPTQTKSTRAKTRCCLTTNWLHSPNHMDIRHLDHPNPTSLSIILQLARFLVPVLIANVCGGQGYKVYLALPVLQVSFEGESQKKLLFEHLNS